MKSVLFRELHHHLHTKADTKNRDLAFRLDKNLSQICKLGHPFMKSTNAGEDDPIRGTNLLKIVRDQNLCSGFLSSLTDTAHISKTIIDDDNGAHTALSPCVLHSPLSNQD